MLGPYPPLVSIIVPVFNRREMISDALASLKAQTYQKIEIIVVDDGSSDGSSEIAEATGDSRIRVVRHAQNLGIPTARNTGLAEARGDYIAWLDSDDLALPRRIERQVAFLETHPEIAMVGSCGGRRDLGGKRSALTRVPVFNHEDIAAELLFRSPYQQSSIMGRTDVLTAYPYRVEFPVCEDLDVFLRIARNHRIANLPEVLIDRRLHAGQTVSTESELIRDRKRVLFREELERLGVAATDEELNLHVTLGRNKRTAQDRGFMKRSERWLEKLVEANRLNPIYHHSSLAFVVATIWAQACRAGCAGPNRVFATSRLARSRLSRGLINRNARSWVRTALPIAAGLTTGVPSSPVS